MVTGCWVFKISTEMISIGSMNRCIPDDQATSKKQRLVDVPEVFAEGCLAGGFG